MGKNKRIKNKESFTYTKRGLFEIDRYSPLGDAIAKRIGEIKGDKISFDYESPNTFILFPDEVEISAPFRVYMKDVTIHPGDFVYKKTGEVLKNIPPERMVEEAKSYLESTIGIPEDVKIYPKSTGIAIEGDYFHHSIPNFSLYSGDLERNFLSFLKKEANKIQSDQKCYSKAARKKLSEIEKKDSKLISDKGVFSYILKDFTGRGGNLLGIVINPDKAMASDFVMQKVLLYGDKVTADTPVVKDNKEWLCKLALRSQTPYLSKNSSILKCINALTGKLDKLFFKERYFRIKKEDMKTLWFSYIDAKKAILQNGYFRFEVELDESLFKGCLEDRNLNPYDQEDMGIWLTKREEKSFLETYSEIEEVLKKHKNYGAIHFSKQYKDLIDKQNDKAFLKYLYFLEEDVFKGRLASQSKYILEPQKNGISVTYRSLNKGEFLFHDINLPVINPEKEDEVESFWNVLEKEADKIASKEQNALQAKITATVRNKSLKEREACSLILYMLSDAPKEISKTGTINILFNREIKKYEYLGGDFLKSYAGKLSGISMPNTKSLLETLIKEDIVEAEERKMLSHSGYSTWLSVSPRIDVSELSILQSEKDREEYKALMEQEPKDEAVYFSLIDMLDRGILLKEQRQAVQELLENAPETVKIYKEMKETAKNIETEKKTANKL